MTPLLLEAGGGMDRSVRPDPLSYVAPSRDYDTKHTRLDLDLDLKNQTIAGSVTHTIRVLKPQTEKIRLNCVGLTVSAVTMDGKPVTFDYPVRGEQATSWIEGADSREATDQLVVYSPAPLAPNDEFDLRIEYSGAPREGLYFIPKEKGIPEKRYEVWAQGEGEDNRYWIPCHDYPNDKSTFDGIFRVDKGMYVLSNGVLVDRRDIGDQTQFHWKLDTPQVSYLITVAAGEYDVIEETWRDVPLLYVVPPGTDRETVTRGYGLTADMMEFFSNYIGIDYPFKKYAQVVVQNFIYGGMENTTATVMNSRTLFDEHAAVTRTEQGLVAHELVHQWWGDMVTCNEWSHIWLNEGFATYFQSLFREHHDGDDEFRYQISARHRDVIKNNNKDPRPIVVDFYNRKDRRNSANVYTKGGSVLHMLRFLIGDEMFVASVRAFGEKHKYGLAETSDFSRAVKETTGENLDWFFEQWVYLAGHPKLLVSKTWQRESNTLKLTISQTQKTEGIIPIFRLPMDVEITTEEKTATYRIVADSETQDFFFTLPSKPLMVIVDKGDWTLKELVFDKPTDELLYQLKHADTMSRIRAIQSLAAVPDDEQVVAALRGVLVGEGYWGVRREAALALGEIGTKNAVAALVEGLDADDAKVRLGSTEALGKVKTSKNLDNVLTNVFRNDYGYEVRAAAVTSLVKMKSPQAKKVSLEALAVDSHRSVIRNAGLNGLVKLKATKEIDEVKKLTGPGNRRTYRHTAITSYAKLAKRLDSERQREKAADYLGSMLDDWYLRTRRTVITALGVLGDESAIDALEQVARTDPIESNRVRARKTATAIQNKQKVIATTENLQSEIDALSTKLESLKKSLSSLEARAPQGSEEPERASTHTEDDE